MAAAGQVQSVQKTGGATGKRVIKEKKKPVKTLSQTAGIGIMIILLAISLVAGNFRALQNVTPKAFVKQGDVNSVIEDRISAAKNAVTVAKRAAIDETYYTAAQTAADQLNSAKTARNISRANQTLTAAVSEMTAAASGNLSSEDQRLLTRAVDTFTEQGNFLRQEARSYNEKADKAVAMYNRLPTRMLFSVPDYFEGL